jgi:hypothetical protein
VLSEVGIVIESDDKKVKSENKTGEVADKAKWKNILNQKESAIALHTILLPG